MAYYVALFLVPLGTVAVVAFGQAVGYGRVAFGLSLENFRRATEGLYLDVAGRTLAFAAGGTVVVVAAALPVAYWLARYAGSRRNVALVALLIPYWTSFLVRTFALLIILSPNWGVVEAVRASGLDAGFDPLGSGLGVFVGIVYNYLPLAVLPVFAALDRVDWRQLDAAYDLGASRLGAFRQVTLPAARAGVVTGALLVFVPMTGEYIVPQLLGTGKSPLVANLIGDQFLRAQDYPFGAALASMLIATVGASAIVVLVLAQRRGRAP
jgi:ABC-type spermidine/putrescine transport system permease subunit I